MISHIILLVCALLIVTRSICALNHMSHRTPHSARLVYIVTGLSGSLVLLALLEIPLGQIPWFKVWLVAGATALFTHMHPLLWNALRDQHLQQSQKQLPH